MVGAAVSAAVAWRLLDRGGGDALDLDRGGDGCALDSGGGVRRPVGGKRMGDERPAAASCGRDEAVGGWRRAEARRHGWGARDARVWSLDEGVRGMRV